MILILAEKPKVAEKIARFLGKNIKRKREGQVVYYEFDRDGERIVVAPAVGHLFTVAEKERTNTYPTLNIKWVPIYEANKKAGYTKQYLDVLKKLCASADQLICATDYDVEGSLIGYKIASFCFPKGNERVKRMKFSAITPRDIENAFKSLEGMDVENAMAGELRHELDWLYGINLSRALMSSLRQMGKFKVMSIGRVQGPALAILAKREEEIKAFKPTPYWQVFAEARGIIFKHKQDRFLKEKEAKKAKEETKSPMKIIKCEKKEQTLFPNPPFDLTTLQTEAYAAFGFSPSFTLQLAQTLYENSLISYPRTTSQKLPSTLPLKSIIQRLSNIPTYSSFAKSILENYKGPRQGKKDDPAHPAIHPTGIFAEMGKDEKKLYDLITRRFLACFMPPTTRVNLVLEGRANTQEYVFKNSFVKKEGWILAYPFVNLGKEIDLEIEKGDLLNISKTWIEKKMTSPPKRFTQASIIKELEKRNLGTKATRAAIIDTLYTRGYIKGKKSIEVTPFGLAVYHALKKNAPLILDEALTRTFEEKMEKIEQKKLDKEVVLEDGLKVLKEILDEVKEHEKDMGRDLLNALNETEDNVIGKCECGGSLKIINYKGKRFVGCSNYPNCKKTYPLPQKGRVEPTGKVCEICKTPIIKVKIKGKKTFETCLSPSCWNKNKKNGKI